MWCNMVAGQQKEKKWIEGHRTSSNYFHCGQKAKEVNILKKKKPNKRSDLAKVKGQKVLCHLLPHASFFVCCFCCHTLPAAPLLISFATSSILCTVRKVILEFWTCTDIYRLPLLALPFLFALSPLPYIFLPISLCQLSALAECHTDACRSAGDRCSSSQAKRRRGTGVKDR